MNQWKRGTQVIYVPNHAQGDVTHPDCEKGFVTSRNGHDYFVRYWNKAGTDLRTKSCGELTSEDNLVAQDSHPQAQVDEMLKRYCDD